MAALEPLYLLMGVTAGISLVGMLIVFHVAGTTESVFVAEMGIYGLMVPLSPVMWGRITSAEAADPVLYGMTTSLGVIGLVAMMLGGKVLENDTESLVISYIAAMVISIGLTKYLLTFVAAIV